MNFRKIFIILPKHRQKQLPFVAAAMVLGAAFEVLGISLIIPLLDIISGTKNKATELLQLYFDLDDRKDIAIVGIAVFALIYLTKGLYLSGLAYLTSKFAYGVKADVNNNLIRQYLCAPYEFHLKQNSAQLLRNLTTETSHLVLYVLNPLLVIVSEGFVIAAIALFLLTIEPLGTIIVMSLLSILSYAFQRLLKRYTINLGQIRQHADGMLIQKSQESLGGIKDIKILGMELKFFEQFRTHNIISSEASAKQNMLGQVPRLYLETIGVITFSVLIFFMVLQGGKYEQIIPVLGLFALAAFRLLPSANRILSSINSLRFAESVITRLSTELTTIKSNELLDTKVNVDNTHPLFQDTIELKGLCYQYPTSSDFAIFDVNLKINRGESIGIIGKSGSGKSTLSDLILGILKPTTGDISFDGRSIYRHIDQWRNLIGCVQQDIFLLDDTIKRNIAFGELDNNIDNDRVASALDEAQLTDFVSTLPDGINTHLGERGVRLSGGQKQRIGIARALYRNAPILLFDEATSALDNDTESAIVSAINNLKGTKTMIVIAHRLSTIEHCNRVIEFNKGQIHTLHV